MRIALSDDSALFRKGLSALFDVYNVEVVFESGDGDSLINFVDSSPPDVAIIDIRMPPSWTDEGIRVAEQIKASHANVGVLIFSGFVDLQVVARLLDLNKVGGVGYLLKDRVSDIPEFLESLRRVQDGEVVIDSSLLEQLFRSRRTRQLLDELSRREQEILQLMAKGQTNFAIGEVLGLSERTVENHLARVFNKLQIPSDGKQNRRVHAVLTWLHATGGLD